MTRPALLDLATGAQEAMTRALLDLATGAQEALTLALLDLAERRTPTPCWRDDRFTSDDADDRSAAALLCLGCPILAPCWNAGQAQTTGVWGGVDRTDHRHTGRR